MPETGAATHISLEDPWALVDPNDFDTDMDHVERVLEEQLIQSEWQPRIKKGACFFHAKTSVRKHALGKTGGLP